MSFGRHARRHATITRASSDSSKPREEKGRKEDMVRKLTSPRKTSHALYVYFQLFIPAGLLGQFGEPLLEVVAAGSSVPGLAIVVL